MFRRSSFGLVVLAALASGCLQKDTVHTLYLSPDGALRWTVDESGVHSDEADAGARFAEEQAYIGPALIGAHPVAIGLQAVGPDGPIRTTVIREERPFHVVTEGRFFRADRAFERLFTDNGIRASVSMETNGDRRQLRMQFDFTRQIQERDGAASTLLEDIERFRFVLTEGQFLAGGGFDVPDRTKAAISREWMTRMEAALKEKRRIDLVLTWTLADGAL